MMAVFFFSGEDVEGKFDSISGHFSGDFFNPLIFAANTASN